MIVEPEKDCESLEDLISPNRLRVNKATARIGTTSVLPPLRRDCGD